MTLFKETVRIKKKLICITRCVVWLFVVKAYDSYVGGNDSPWYNRKTWFMWKCTTRYTITVSGYKHHVRILLRVQNAIHVVSFFLKHSMTLLPPLQLLVTFSVMDLGIDASISSYAQFVNLNSSLSSFRFLEYVVSSVSCSCTRMGILSLLALSSMKMHVSVIT